MSFSFDTKEELCRIEEKRRAAMLYGMILFADKVSADKMQITSENVFVINRLEALASALFDVHFLVDESASAYTATLTGNALKTVLTAFHMDAKSVQLHFNADILSDEHDRAAFLRGIFLVGGSVSNPYTGYHLELVSHYYRMSQDLLLYLNGLGFPFKSVVRKSHYVLYMKDSTAVEQFLYIIGANQSAFTLVNAKIYKQVQNYHNRLNNCEEYNRDKSMDKCIEQILAIRRIMEMNKFAALPEDLKAVAELRMENQRDSLAALAEKSAGRFSKAGLSRKLAKLVEFSEKLTEK